MSVLAERLLAVHDSLDAARFPHAFGGAIALAYCTEEPRGTRDIDVNIFVEAAVAPSVLRALPPGVTVHDADVDAAVRDGQVRMWWDDTPIDVFLDVHEFHRQLPTEVRDVPFEGRSIPVLGCTAVVILKAMFNRTKDWADVEAVVAAGTFDATEALGWLVQLLGADDPAVERLANLTSR
jgi:hypothetical protein